MPIPACPATKVRVIGQIGKTLRIASYDMLTNTLIGESTQFISTGDQEFLVVWATPTSRTLVLAVLEVISGTTIYERWAQPFIYIPNATKLTLPSSEYSVAYISKLGGVTKFIEKTSEAWLDPMNITIIRKTGYLAIYDGTTKVVEATGKSAIFELSVQVPGSIAKAFANYIDDNDVASIVYKEYGLADWVGALTYVKLLINNLRFTNVGTTVYRTTGGDYVVKCRFYADLYSSIDWNKVLVLIGGIVSVVAGVALAALSAGLSLPASVTLIISGISIVTGTAIIMGTQITEEPSETVSRADELVTVAVKEITDYKDSLFQYIDSLVAQGRITQDEANKLKDYVNSITNTAINAIQELNKLVKRAYDEGYKKGVEDSKMWIIVAGLGGLIGGLIIGHR
jgi:polyhydroxyalkanoate synthesis regulator phasin